MKPEHTAEPAAETSPQPAEHAESAVRDAAANATSAQPSASPSSNEVYGETMKSKGGLIRIWRACTYSRDGFIEAFRHEHAFRQELYLVVPLFVVAACLPVSWSAKAVLAASLLFVLLVEMLNSAIESCVDYISVARHPLAKRAKDMGSAAVTLAFLIAGFIWVAVLLPLF